MAWYLVASDGPVSGSAFRLLNESVTIGRDSDNDIVVDDHMVSRHHARLTRQAEDGYVVTDLGSTNGTWVNNQRARPSTPVNITFGDKLTLGTKSSFVLSSEPFVEDVTMMGPPTTEPDLQAAGVASAVRAEDLVLPGGEAAPPAAAPVPAVRNANWVCPACGSPNPAGTRFCGNCGSQLTVHREVLCASCSALNEAGRRFCGNCGQPLVAPPTLSHTKSRSGISPLLVVIMVAILAFLVMLTAFGFAAALNLGGLRDALTSDPPEQALALADEYVAANDARFVGGERTVAPAPAKGRRVFTVRYSLPGGDTLVLLVDLKTDAVTVVNP